jgi:hypothetical protein
VALILCCYGDKLKENQMGGQCSKREEIQRDFFKKKSLLGRDQ